MSFVRTVSAWVCLVLIGVVIAAAPVTVQDRDSAVPTFSKNVLPILQKHCQTCHRPGEAAPMSFLTYESTRPWARAIKTAVQAKQMPPWFADPQHGRFSNERTLTSVETQTLTRWVDGGALQGDRRDAPAPIKWPEGWQIAPDITVTGPSYDIPANGTVEWGYVVIPSGFEKDTWVTSIEVRPTYRDAVHHVVVFVKPHTSDIPYNVFFWDRKERNSSGAAPGQPFQTIARTASTGQTRGSALGGEIAAVYVPGVPPQDFRVHNAAKLIPANSDLVLQIHYTPIGKVVTEATHIGFTVATVAPDRQFLTLALQPTSIMDPKIFRIPAREPNWASPPVETLFNVEAQLVWMMPHMHVRGKDMTYQLTFPDGRSMVALHVPRYDFNWQIGYDVSAPIHLPKGTTLRVDAHFDNSSAKRDNPNPNEDVYGGTQSWEEMMNPWFGVLVDRNVDSAMVLTTKSGTGGGGR